MGSIQNFLSALPSFIILIGVLIFVHEAGHFFFAKLFKVKVHVFSLGFGPKLFSFRRGETLYQVSLVPIGGYVRMLGEDPSEDVPPEDKGRAFGDQPLWQRFLIIVAGPVMNIVFPLFLHFGVGLTYTTVLPAEVGVVLPGMPAHEAGLLPGDIIEAVDGKNVASFFSLVEEVKPRPGEKIRFAIRRGDKRFDKVIVPRPTVVPIILDEKETIGLIGIGRGYLPSLVGLSNPGSPAAQAGIETFDLIVAVDDKPIDTLIELERSLVSKAGSKTVLTVRRLKQDAVPPFAPFEDQFAKKTLALTIQVPPGTENLASLGIGSSRDFVAHVTPGGEAEAIGIERGDRLLSLDGTPYELGQIFAAIDQKPDQTRTLAWTRDGQNFSAPFKPQFIPAGEAGDLGIKQDRYDKGFWALGGKQILPAEVPNPAVFAGALQYAWDETGRGIRFIGIGFKLLFTGQVSLRSLGGPIMIGQLAGQAAQQGAEAFFWIMALISLNLGLLNLLPIPVLDGGQIVFIIVELITKRPISLIIKERIMLVGVVMLLALMVFATWNDIARILVG
jgi:regulator of sigma E protease